MQTRLKNFTWFFIGIILVFIVLQYKSLNKTKIKFYEYQRYFMSPPKINEDYNKLFDIDFKFLINPQICDGPDSLLYVIIIHSRPTNYNNRDVIRKTYGKDPEMAKVVFLLGQSLEEETGMKVKSEAATYNDIVQGSFIDAYVNLTYKHVMGLKWVGYHCSDVPYILKVDDDVIVNTFELPKYLSEFSPKKTNFIQCAVYKKSPTVRNKKSKWYVSETEFPDPYYPPYCHGVFIIYSQDVVIKILEASQKLRYFFVDDALLTGIVAKKIHVTPTELGSLSLKTDLVELKKKDGKLPTFLMGSRQLNYKKMADMWKAMD